MSNSDPIYFDIETGPEELEICGHLMPEFSARSNYKDELKIAANIAEQREAWLEKRPLAAMSGRILAVGIIKDGNFCLISDIEGEAHLLSTFWDTITDHGAFTRKVIGFNSNRFDLPFLIRRSWLMQVDMPATVMTGRYLNSHFVDLMEMWQCGDRQASVSLDKLSKYFGLEGKNGEGKFFYQLWENDRDKAIQYLENDLYLTKSCADAMGVR